MRRGTAGERLRIQLVMTGLERCRADFSPSDTRDKLWIHDDALARRSVDPPDVALRDDNLVKPAGSLGR